MKLIEEIIAALSSQDGSLTDALLKTKVLLHQIGHKELVDWVNNELNGYPGKTELPSYRILPATIIANMSNGAWKADAHPVPLGHLEENNRKKLELARMDQSLAVLEKLVENPKGSLQSPLDMDFNGILGQSLASGFVIQRAWRSISKPSVAQIFIQVRSRLLDFILELKDQIGDSGSEKEAKIRAGKIDTAGLFNNAIFGNTTTIIVGSGNQQNVANLVFKGDFNTLADYLKQQGIEEADITELQHAINSDESAPEVKENKVGPAVRDWLKRMTGKAIDMAWQIELGVASGLMTSALQQYYGWFK